MAQVLYRKYRSRKFSEVIGQDHITSTLIKAIKSGKLSHAYLFTGPRGVGKTSVARILAHEINGLPYTDDRAHLDIIEIDAASNRRIDEVRELRDKLHNSPAAAKYKVYIIDEAHMLTREAFNALLKTLEEPPAHVVFILATTEAHKLPETIISRTQRFSFKPIAKDTILKQLKAIAQSESIKAEDPALELIASHGHGSFRDSISLLDQLSAGGQLLTLDKVEDALGLPATAAIEELADKILAGNAAACLQALQRLKEQAANPSLVAAQLGTYLRAELVNGRTNSRIIEFLRQLLEVPSASNPEELLEIAVLEATLQERDSDDSENAELAVKSTNHEGTATDSKVDNTIQPSPKSSEFSYDKWQSILSAVKEKSSGLYTALRLAKVEAVEGELHLLFKFPLHQKKILQLTNLELIHQAAVQVLGNSIEIKAFVDKNLDENLPYIAKSDSIDAAIDVPPADTEAFSSIFGSVEVLES